MKKEQLIKEVCLKNIDILNELLPTADFSKKELIKQIESSKSFRDGRNTITIMIDSYYIYVVDKKELVKGGYGDSDNEDYKQVDKNQYIVSVQV